MTYDVIIVGGGAAGATCALYLGRANLSTLVLDHGRTTLKRANLCNFPALPPTPGLAWLELVRDQAAALESVRFNHDSATGIANDEAGHFVVRTEDGELHARHVVLATGQNKLRIADGLGVAEQEPLQPFVKTNFVVDRWGATSIPNLYAVGVLAGFPSQAIICAASGANTAIRIASIERGEFYVDHDLLALERGEAAEPT